VNRLRGVVKTMVDKERPKTGIRDMLDSLYRETKLARNTGVFDRK